MGHTEVTSNKNTKILPMATINPETGKLAVNKRDIDGTVIEYCIETLASNKPEQMFKKEIQD